MNLLVLLVLVLTSSSGEPAWGWTLRRLSEKYRNNSLFLSQPGRGVDPLIIAIDGIQGSSSGRDGVTWQDFESFSKRLDELVRGRIAGGTAPGNVLQEISALLSQYVSGDSYFPSCFGVLKLAFALAGLFFIVQLLVVIFKHQGQGALSLVGTMLIIAVVLSPPGYNVVGGLMIGILDDLGDAVLGPVENKGRATSLVSEVNQKVRELSEAVRRNMPWQSGSGSHGSLFGGGGADETALAFLQDREGGGVVENVIARIVNWAARVVAFVFLGVRQLILAVMLYILPFLVAMSIFEPARLWVWSSVTMILTVSSWKLYYSVITGIINAVYIQLTLKALESGGRYLTALGSGQMEEARRAFAETQTFDLRVVVWQLLYILAVLAIPRVSSIANATIGEFIYSNIIHSMTSRLERVSDKISTTIMRGTARTTKGSAGE